jgi:pyrimidine-nucleoside phosphorylase
MCVIFSAQRAIFEHGEANKVFLPAQIIQKKRDGHALTEEEIKFFVLGFTRGEIPDYQMAAMAMAICFIGMNFDETMWLTKAMVESGEIVDWQGVSGYKADKHSTGGIGDKVSLVLAPLVASCGVKVPMISGRGLGPTGGTLDKLESIKGFNVNLSLKELVKITDKIGCCMIGQTKEIAPADKKLYALRDVTATVSCLPLIVASIMSKKLAENVDGLVLDVKWGTGAFMRTRESSLELGRAMVEVGKRYGKTVRALQTDMNQPLGQRIGNALEVLESVEILHGDKTPADLIEVTLALAAEMLLMADAAKTREEAIEIMEQKIADGSAAEKFAEMIDAQGGDAKIVEDTSRLPRAKHTHEIKSPVSGCVHAIECDQIGYAVIALGGGRQKTDDKIDFAVGFEHPKKIGDVVKEGEPLMLMHYNDEKRAAQAERMIVAAYKIGPEPVKEKPKLITETIA